MICPKCKFKNSENTTFCLECGLDFESKAFITAKNKEVLANIIAITEAKFVSNNKQNNGPMGCLFILLGLCLTPFIIGIFVLVYGILLMLNTKVEEYYTGDCPYCSRAIKLRLGKSGKQSFINKENKVTSISNTKCSYCYNSINLLNNQFYTINALSKYLKDNDYTNFTGYD